MPFYLFLIFVYTSFSFAQIQVSNELFKGDHTFNVGDSIWIQPGVESLNQLSIHNWKPATDKKQFKEPEFRHVYWSKVLIENTSKDTLNLIVWYPGDIHQITQYINPSFNQQNDPHCVTGTTVPYSKRIFKESYLNYCPVKLSPFSQTWIFTQVKKDHSKKVTASMKIMDATHLENNLKTTYTNDKIYTGTILTIIILSLVGWAFIKTKSMFYYAAYLICHLFALYSLNGYFFFIFKLENAFSIQYLGTLSAQICFIFFFIFHQTFLNLSYEFPKLNQIISYWIRLKIFLIIPIEVTLLMTDRQYILNQWVFDFHTLEALFLLGILVWLASRKIPFSLWALFANFLAIFGYLITSIISSKNGLSNATDALQTVQLGLTLEAFILFVGIIWQFGQKTRRHYNSIKQLNTIMIQHQSRQIETIYFVNHFLRRPVAHILGLNQILQNPTTSEDEKQKVLNYLDQVTLDLNTVVSRLNSSLEKDTSLAEDNIRGNLRSALEIKAERIQEAHPDSNCPIEISVDEKLGYNIIPEIEIFIFHLLHYLVEQKAERIIIKFRQGERGPWLQIKAPSKYHLFYFLNQKRNDGFLRQIGEINQNLLLCFQILETKSFDVESGRHKDTIKILLKKLPSA